jgi:hypothetical protein
VTVFRTAFHAFTLSISNTWRPKFETERRTRKLVLELQFFFSKLVSMKESTIALCLKALEATA